MKTLVFLEHHDGAIQKGSLGVLSKAASLGDVSGILIGQGAREAAAEAAAHGAATVHVADSSELSAPLAQPRVDVLAKVAREGGYDAVFLAQSVLAADIAAALAVRLDTGLNWDLVDVREEGGSLVGVRPALGDSVHVDTGWRSQPAVALFRAGSFEPVSADGAGVTIGVRMGTARGAAVRKRLEPISFGPGLEPPSLPASARSFRLGMRALPSPAVVPRSPRRPGTTSRRARAHPGPCCCSRRGRVARSHRGFRCWRRRPRPRWNQKP